MFGLVVGIPVILLFGILIVHGYFANRNEAIRTMRSRMLNEVKTQAKTLNHHLAMMSRIPSQVALAITVQKPESVGEMHSFQYAMLADNPTVYGTAVAWEPYAFDPKEKYCSPYVWRDINHGGAVSDIMFNPENDYDYFKGWDWYDEPKKKYGSDDDNSTSLEFSKGESEKRQLPRFGAGLWSAPYYDEGGGNVLMCTYSAPFFQKNRFSGVVTCDVTTDWIEKFLAREAFADGYFMLLDKDGTVISHPNFSLIMKRIDDVFSDDKETVWEKLKSELKIIAQRPEADIAQSRLPDNPNHEGEYIRELSLILSGKSPQKTLWTEGIRLPETDWTLLCLVPSSAVFETTNAQFQSNILIFMFGLLLLSLCLFWYLEGRIIRPIRRLTLATNAIAGGDFDHHIEVQSQTGRELIDLSLNFNSMARALRQSIAEAVRNASAKETAEASNRAKSEFLMIISHELRTPLSGVIGTAELLLQTSLTSKQHEYATLQKESGFSLLLLINNILDFSKSELGQISIREEDFNLRSLIESVLLLLKAQAKSRNISLVCDFAETIEEHVRSDEGRIRQVLLNLIGNAIKFSKNNEVLLRLILRESLHERQIVRFEVTDHGIGISEEQRKTLFDPFWQVDTSSKRNYDGLGLGLTISKRILDALGGEIDVQSTAGKGSTFGFTIPLAKGRIDPSLLTPIPTSEPTPIPPTATQTLIPPAPVPLAETPALLQKTIRILVAEDNRINQIVIKEVLTSAGYHCEIVANGAKAVQFWEEQEFDLILMDCQMPEVDGYEATSKIREKERSRQTERSIPIIALTANTAPGDKERCLLIGMNSYCNKPINSKELIDTIDFWIEKEKA